MEIQPRTFHPLPAKEKILRAIANQEKRISDLTSYMWYILPVAHKFGDNVYEVAARSLSESGISVTATQLKELAQELKTPEGMQQYAEQRLRHLGSITRMKLPGGGTMSATG
jgi:hypothetical protein